MKRQKRRILCGLLAALCLFPASGAAAKTSTVTSFQPMSAKKYGVPVSSIRRHEGDFSLRWGGLDLSRDITFDIKNKDFQNGTFLMWIYSTNATKLDFTVMLLSDNPETNETDGYRAGFWNYWIGWRQLKWESGSDDFTVIGDPLGYDKVTNIVLSAAPGERSTVGTELYLDSLMFRQK